VGACLPALGCSAALTQRATATRRDRSRSMVDSVHAEDRPHLAAMVRAVSAAAPCSAPSHAHLRLLRGAPAERAPSSWIWAEFKLFSDVRTRRRAGSPAAAAAGEP
jgi:hypothetical protein